MEETLILLVSYLCSKEFRFSLKQSLSSKDVASQIRQTIGLKDDKPFNAKWLDNEGKRQTIGGPFVGVQLWADKHRPLVLSWLWYDIMPNQDLAMTSHDIVCPLYV